jgi:hypothetical protein
LGTTSFRTNDFNELAERQLDLMDRFRTANSGAWRELQTAYYRFIQGEGFISSSLNNRRRPHRL